MASAPAFGGMLFRGQGAQCQGMNHCVAHILAERPIYQLVLLHEAFTNKVSGHDHSLEMLAVVTGNAHLRTGKPGLDEALDVFGTSHINFGDWAAHNALQGAASIRRVRARYKERQVMSLRQLRILYPRRRSSSVSADNNANDARTTAKLSHGLTSETPKKP